MSGGHFKDLTGKKFGRLTVIEKTDKRVSGCVVWRCVCDCGNECFIIGSNLTRGNTMSCGCLAKELISKVNYKHGQNNTKIHSIYDNMKSRCYNENTESYSLYGGRGITVCDEWLNDFQVFYDWAMANGYRDGLSIDRINNDEGYYPENCRWVTVKEQANNRRSNRLITFDDETHTLTEWAKIKNISPKTLFTRIYDGWSVESALITPTRKRKQ